jgi:hypothetical protein
MSSFILSKMNDGSFTFYAIFKINASALRRRRQHLGIAAGV